MWYGNTVHFFLSKGCYYLWGASRQLSQVLCPTWRVGPFLSQWPEGDRKSYSQGSLTKEPLSSREHHTNITKMHDGECKLDVVSVSAIEIKISLLGLYNRENPSDFSRKLQEDDMTGLARVAVHPLAFSPVRVFFASSLSQREGHSIYSTPKGQKRRPRIFLALCCTGWQLSLWRFLPLHFHPLQQAFKIPILVAFTDIVRFRRAMSIHIYRV